MAGNDQGAWTGRWVWCPRPWIRRTGEFSGHPVVAEDAHDRRVLFRREFDLGPVPASCLLRIAADSRYVVWVNGVEVGRGPVRTHPWRLHHDVLDVAGALRTGRNAIAVLVRFYGLPNAWWVPATPTFSHGAGVLAAELALPDGLLGTDRDWRCQVSEAWTPQRPRGVGSVLPEVFDGRLLDPAWTSAGFDDSGWVPARVLTALHLGGIGRSVPPTDPYGPLPEGDRRVSSARDQLPESVCRRVVAADLSLGPVELTMAVGFSVAGDPVELPVSVDSDAAVVFTADWGRMVAGTVELCVDAEPGVVVTARMAESLDGGASEFAMRCVTRDGENRFESSDPTGGRYAVVVVHGRGRVSLRRIAVRERLRPRPSGAFFECSDPVLNRIYEVGLRTVDLTAQDAYVDCPTREQRAWIGDAVVHQSVDLLTNPDWSLAKAYPLLAAAPRPDGMLPMAVVCDFEHHGTSYIPDWALHWVRSVHNLWRWTGDGEVVASLLPVVENLLRWFARYVRDGLLTDVTGWVLLDWASVQGRGAGAVLNGLWGRALLDFAEMASWLGDEGRARWARDHHARLCGAYAAFWDESRGAYRDWLGSPSMSDHASAAAVVGGLVPFGRRDAVLSFLLERGDRVRRAWSFGVMPLMAAMGPPAPDWDVASEVVEAQPFFRYVVHDAVALLGGSVGELCRDWAVFEGATTWPETWSGGSRCHGWSSTPTRDLPMYVLGVSPALPGFDAVRVAPRLGDLSWARGAVPSPHGPITVEVSRDRVWVDSPVPIQLDLDGTVRHEPAGTFELITAGR
ncbi:alpha-L-rhamnosidase N-terminal domain-containing protein [Actinokineospora enzanensis]|uniref:alpha-L-rhamnosidase-related protein n=1 Tax=Actinokineospora enzanensis TaxID=155975 RepID=UPI00146C9355|nr:alpha-L-rhamnosidase N-terminal domain-containing protein [Actinokineospora enzanensis]